MMMMIEMMLQMLRMPVEAKFTYGVSVSRRQEKTCGIDTGEKTSHLLPACYNRIHRVQDDQGEHYGKIVLVLVLVL
eukprot:698979-Hanusia_phi.AAC.1